MSDPVAHTPKEDSKSEEFRDGDVFIRSSDRVLFQVHLENLKLVSTAFPSSVNTSDKVIDFQEDGETLEILFYFVYPQKSLPNLYSLSFKTLMKVLEASDKWGMYHAIEIIQLHLQKYASMYPRKILASPPNQDCDFLLAAVAPYLANLSIAEMQALAGLSDKLCVKWGIYRENILMALYEGRRSLGNHDAQCRTWRSQTKVFLMSKLEALTGPKFLNDKGVWDAHADVMIWMSNTPGCDLICCRVALEKWRALTLQKLNAVQFPI